MFSYSHSLLFIVLVLISKLTKAERKGSITCHSGSRIPGSYHGSVDGSLEDGSFQVLVDDVVMSLDQINIISPKPHILKLERTKRDFMGVYMRADGGSSVDASRVLSENACDYSGDVKGGPNWYVGGNKVSCPSGVSGITQTDSNDKTEVIALLDMSSLEGLSIDVEITAMTSSVRRYYYSSIQFEVESNLVPSNSSNTTDPCLVNNINSSSSATTHHAIISISILLGSIIFMSIV